VVTGVIDFDASNQRLYAPVDLDQPAVGLRGGLGRVRFALSSADGFNNFGVGLMQGMISTLGRFGELRVLARGVASAHTGRVPSAIDLWRALGVDYAVDGNLRGDGSLSRIDMRLSDARTGAQVWSRSFEANGAVAGRLATEDEISGKASAMVGGYWGAIGTAEYRRIQNNVSPEIEPGICDPRGGRLLPHVVLRAILSREDAGRPANGPASAMKSLMAPPLRILHDTAALPL
jgi:TolB-like protein